MKLCRSERGDTTDSFTQKNGEHPFEHSPPYHPFFLFINPDVGVDTGFPDQARQVPAIRQPAMEGTVHQGHLRYRNLWSMAYTVAGHAPIRL